MLSGKTVVLGITGGIAAYKACEIVSRLKKAGVDVHVIMTKSACEFVQPLTLQTLSQNLVATDTFESPKAYEVEHISLAKKADVFLIAPATANIIAKMANGLADDMLTTTYLATQAKLLLAPAMNTVMWQHEATQKNLNTLKARGAHTIGPDGGLLACGDVGAGRMSEPDAIVEATLALLAEKGDLIGKKVLVTAGPTRENIDPVRYITNRSSGKMGYAIARAAMERGAEVTLVTGPVNQPLVPGVKLQNITTTQDLYEVMMREAPKQDILIQSAAPADFKMNEISDQKIKKQGDGRLRLELVKTPDVAQAVGEKKIIGQFFAGFAAETEEGLVNAQKKLVSKHLDLIALNDVTKPGVGFDVDTNALTLISKDREIVLPLMTKDAAAHKLLDEIVNLMKTGEKDA